jgi:hypothetical protein
VQAQLIQSPKFSPSHSVLLKVVSKNLCLLLVVVVAL